MFLCKCKFVYGLHCVYAFVCKVYAYIGLHDGFRKKLFFLGMFNNVGYSYCS